MCTLLFFCVGWEQIIAAKLEFLWKTFLDVQDINNGFKIWLLFSLQIRGSRSRALHDRAIINCQYSMATFSTAERKRRPHGDRKSTEMSLHLKQTFEAAVLTQLYPRSQIDIYVKVRNCDL